MNYTSKSSYNMFYPVNSNQLTTSVSSSSNVYLQGKPTTDTPSINSSDNQIATTEFVQELMNKKITNSLKNLVTNTNFMNTLQELMNSNNKEIMNDLSKSFSTTINEFNSNINSNISSIINEISNNISGEIIQSINTNNLQIINEIKNNTSTTIIHSINTNNLQIINQLNSSISNTVNETINTNNLQIINEINNNISTTKNEINNTITEINNNISTTIFEIINSNISQIAQQTAEQTAEQTINNIQTNIVQIIKQQIVNNNNFFHFIHVNTSTDYYIQEKANIVVETPCNLYLPTELTEGILIIIINKSGKCINVNTQNNQLIFNNFYLPKEGGYSIPINDNYYGYFIITKNNTTLNNTWSAVIS